MISPKLRKFTLGAITLAALALNVGHSHAQQVWFSPRSAPAYSEQFYSLFQTGAPWQGAAGHVSAFELSIQLETQASDGQLKTVIDGLRSKHIVLALDMLPLTGRGKRIAPDGCGLQVEGYASSLQSLEVAKRFNALGASVAYFDMDEPLYFGHFFNGPNACHSPLDQLIADVSEKIREVRTQYPQAQFGESEPIMAVTEFGLGDLEHWLDAFELQTHKPLAFLRLDMNWNSLWQSRIAEVAHLLKRKGVRLQVIYNGSPRDMSDATWIADALSNAAAFERVATPDDVIIQSWDSYPKRYLPETDPTTMTALINRYLAARKVR